MPRQGKVCKVLGCLSRSTRNPDKKFYPFAKPWIDREKCLRWIAATGRKDFPVEYVNKECYVCQDHFVNAGPSPENPDPLPGNILIKEVGVHVSPELGENSGNVEHGETCGDSDLVGSCVKTTGLGHGLSSGRQTVFIFEKEELPPKKYLRVCQASDRLPISDENKSSQQASVLELHHNPCVSQGEDVSSLSGKLFDDFVNNIEKNDTTGIEVISPLHNVLSQGTSKENVDSRCISEKDGKRSVSTQTMNRCTMKRLIASGKCGKVAISSTGVQILSTNTEYEDEEEDDEPAEKEEKLRTSYLSFESISSDDHFEYLSGMSRSNFELLYKFLGGDDVCSVLKYEVEEGPPKALRVLGLSLRTRLFLTLCHLRRGFTERELSIFFGCSVSLVSRVLSTWINFLYLELKPLEEQVPHGRRSQTLNMLQRFKSFKELKVIIDCTEVKVEPPSNLQEEGHSLSSYKHSHTVKYLVGINVRGAICYISEAFEGSTSDKEAFHRSSMYDMLQPGDVVMADREFDISEDLDRKKVELVIPAYLTERNYPTSEKEVLSKKIMRAKDFVQNAIGRLTMWRILDSTFPQNTRPLVSKMMFVCACLANFQAPLL